MKNAVMQRGDREEADLARPQRAAANPDRERHGGERARIEQSHVLREEKIGQPEALVPGPAARAPEVDLGVHRAEQVGKREREQVRPVQRAAPGFDVS